MKPEEREIAERLAIDIQKGNSSIIATASLSPSKSSRPSSEYLEHVAHNVPMRLKGAESNFSGNTTECWDEFAGTCVQITKAYGLSNEQMLQVLHDLLSKDALNSTSLSSFSTKKHCSRRLTWSDWNTTARYVKHA